MVKMRTFLNHIESFVTKSNMSKHSQQKNVCFKWNQVITTFSPFLFNFSTFLIVIWPHTIQNFLIFLIVSSHYMFRFTYKSLYVYTSYECNFKTQQTCSNGQYFTLRLWICHHINESGISFRFFLPFLWWL